MKLYIVTWKEYVSDRERCFTSSTMVTSEDEARDIMLDLHADNALRQGTFGAKEPPYRDMRTFEVEATEIQEAVAGKVGP